MLGSAGYAAEWHADGLPDPSGASTDGAAPVAAVVDPRLADGSDGREVIRRLRRERPEMPVLVVTGFHGEAPQADLRGLGGPTVRLCKAAERQGFLNGLAALLHAPAKDALVPRRRATDGLPLAA